VNSAWLKRDIVERVLAVAKTRFRRVAKAVESSCAHREAPKPICD